MKKLAILLLMFVSGLHTFGQAAQLSPNSIQIPQVNGTNSVANPANGMLIYNLSDHSLYYRKQSEWVKINNNTNNVVANPTIYYTITSSGNAPAVPGEITSGIHAGQTKVDYVDYNFTLNYDPTNAGGAGSGKAVISPVKISKPRGANSIPFFKVLTKGLHFDTMEFLFYDASDQLYYSVKLSSVFVSKIEKSELEGVDTIELKSLKMGWKDYPRNVFGTFDITMNSFTDTY
ncbi:MAG TPA: type VI secretion system tube protein Hcp [Emticicia sp.]